MHRCISFADNGCATTVKGGGGARTGEICRKTQRHPNPPQERCDRNTKGLKYPLLPRGDIRVLFSARNGALWDSFLCAVSRTLSGNGFQRYRCAAPLQAGGGRQIKESRSRKCVLSGRLEESDTDATGRGEGGRGEEGKVEGARGSGNRRQTRRGVQMRIARGSYDATRGSGAELEQPTETTESEGTGRTLARGKSAAEKSAATAGLEETAPGTGMTRCWRKRDAIRGRRSNQTARLRSPSTIKPSGTPSGLYGQDVGSVPAAAARNKSQWQLQCPCRHCLTRSNYASGVRALRKARAKRIAGTGNAFSAPAVARAGLPSGD